MKIFVTGALGFIGRALLERYRAAGADVGGIDRVAEPELGVVAGDVNEPAGWSERMKDADILFHTAAVVSNVASEQAFWTVNVLGTRRVLEAATDAGVGRFVHLSSVAAYGFEFPDEIDETYPVRPDGNHYVDTKVASEQVVLQAHAAAEIAASIVRPTDVYGPGSRPWTQLPVEMLRSHQFLLPAGGRGIFSPIYVDNLIDGLQAVGEVDVAAGQVFILGDGSSLTTGEFFGNYARMLGGARLPTLPTPLAKGVAGLVGGALGAIGRETEASAETMRMLARSGTYSIEKARRLLGYEPGVDLEEGMRRSERWLADQGLLD
jgi:nucleoside-diphosphate-sugar epimerase